MVARGPPMCPENRPLFLCHSLLFQNRLILPQPSMSLGTAAGHLGSTFLLTIHLFCTVCLLKLLQAMVWDTTIDKNHWVSMNLPSVSPGLLSSIIAPIQILSPDRIGTIIICVKGRICIAWRHPIHRQRLMTLKIFMVGPPWSAPLDWLPIQANPPSQPCRMDSLPPAPT